MPTIMITHDVTDTDRWLSSPKREEILPSLGASNIRTFVNPQDRTKVGLVMDIRTSTRCSRRWRVRRGAHRGDGRTHGPPRDHGGPHRVLSRDLASGQPWTVCAGSAPCGDA